MGISRALAMASAILIDVFRIPLSILLICEISTPMEKASFSCVKPFSFRSFFRFFPKAIRNSLFLSCPTFKCEIMSK